MELFKAFVDQASDLKPIPTEMSVKVARDKDIKMVIFDIYGTLLVSTSGDIEQATLNVENMTKAFESCGIQFQPANKEEHAKSILADFIQTIATEHKTLRDSGIRFPEIEIRDIWSQILERAHEKNIITGDIDNETKDDLAMAFEILSNPVTPMPNMVDVLHKLADKKIPLGIVSNAQFYTPIVMSYFLSDKIEKTDIIPLFDSDASVFSYKHRRGKPDTFLFEYLLTIIREAYQLEPENLLYIGNDMYKDIYPAQKSGIKTVLFAGDKRSLRLREDKEEIKGITPDYIINDLEQIFEIV